MPVFGWILDDRKAVAVLTCIRNSRRNAAAAVTGDRVAPQLHNLAKGKP
jgi:hypothetical protein